MGAAGRSPSRRAACRSKDTESEALAEKLMLAGYPAPYAVRAFVLIKTGADPRPAVVRLSV